MGDLDDGGSTVMGVSILLVKMVPALLEIRPNGAGERDGRGRFSLYYATR